MGAKHELDVRRQAMTASTRRTVIGSMAFGAGAAALHSLVPRAGRAQDDNAGLTARIARDLELHAAFGPKFSGGSGDVQTAEWIAERLARSGYSVDTSTFDAPFFVSRRTRLRV